MRVYWCDNDIYIEPVIYESYLTTPMLIDKMQSFNVEKTVTVTTRFVTLGDGSYAGTPPPGGYSGDGESGGRTNRSGMARSSGISIGSITVQSAPGERAEESVPRALRRFAFVAGLNG